MSSDYDRYHARIATSTRLLAERNRLGLSQEDLAITTGISRKTQAAYEKGTSAIPLDYLHALETLEIDIRFIAFGAADSPPSPPRFDGQRRGPRRRLHHQSDDYYSMRRVDVPTAQVPDRPNLAEEPDADVSRPSDDIKL